MRSEGVTIKDIARETGFSVATVSRILSGTDYPVNAQTRTRVEECAKRLGYVPNLFARGLKTNVSTEIGVVIPSFRNPFYTDALTGIEQEAGRAGYEMVVYLKRDGHYDSVSIIESILRKKTAGLIIASDCFDENMKKALQEYSGTLPVILLDGVLPGAAPLHGVYFDYRQGARMASEYLLKNGHTETALITKRRDRETRLSVAAGFKEAFELDGHPRSNEDIFESELADDFAAGAALAEEVLDSGRPYTAVLANNDSVAAGALSTMMKRNRRVPKEMSVMGMDDNVFSRMTMPPLTTVQIPSLDAGTLAAKYLVDSINGKPLSYDVYLHSGIIERGSVGRIIK